jgi:excisionase family DNA binding protein
VGRDEPIDEVQVNLEWSAGDCSGRTRRRRETGGWSEALDSYGYCGDSANGCDRGGTELATSFRPLPGSNTLLPLCSRQTRPQVDEAVCDFLANVDQILTVWEVAELLRITRQTVYRLAREGKIPAFRIGTDWRFRRDAIDRFMKRPMSIDDDDAEQS